LRDKRSWRYNLSEPPSSKRREIRRRDLCSRILTMRRIHRMNKTELRRRARSKGSMGEHGGANILLLGIDLCKERR
jgi:hypothetical protein